MYQNIGTRFLISGQNFVHHQAEQPNLEPTNNPGNTAHLQVLKWNGSGPEGIQKELFNQNLADLRSSGAQFFEPHGSTKTTTLWMVLLTHSLARRLCLLALCISLQFSYSSHLTCDSSSASLMMIQRA